MNNKNASIKKREKIVKRTLPRLGTFVRDVNLPDDIAKKYVPNMIIRERGFVDTSYKIKGMVTTHRFLILSNQMKSLEPFEHGTKWGLCLSKNDARYKILTVHEYCQKTLILLLQLPEDDNWKIFLDLEFNPEDKIITESIELFEYMCNLEALPELTTSVWLERCSSPIGLDYEGNYFDIE